eukprot:4413804-Lingulodinium_polyedra.AAC.1
MECPKPLAEARLATLATYLGWQTENPPMPAWAGAVARARECFQDTILVVPGADGARPRYYLFLYAVISPTYLAFSPVEYIVQPP